MITHVVLMKFTEESRQANRDRARDMLLSMVGKVETLRHLEVGLDEVHSDRSCDLALVTRFDDMPGLEAYRIHPVHVEVKRFLQDVTEMTHVVDYKSH